MYNNSEKHLSNLAAARLKAHEKFQCRFCTETRTKSNISKHEKSCNLNPNNTKLCEHCNNPMSNGSKKTRFCSYSCSNLGSPRKKALTSYRSICFDSHNKQCVVCGEINIVAVHHLDEDHNNNDHKNLIPLCPTHHQYMHSRYKHLIQNIIDEYILCLV